MAVVILSVLPNKWLIYVAGPMLNDEANLLPQKGYWLLDANIYYRLDNGLTLSAYSRNITNTIYSSWGSTLGALGQNFVPVAPRTNACPSHPNFRHGYVARGGAVAE